MRENTQYNLKDFSEFNHFLIICMKFKILFIRIKDCMRLIDLNFEKQCIEIVNLDFLRLH